MRKGKKTMRVNVDGPVKIIGGKAIQLEEGKDATLKDVCLFVLNALVQGEVSQDGEEKYKRFKLGLAIDAGGEVEMKAEEIVLLKKCGAKVLTPFAYGAFADLLDPPKEE
jgi:hypothetical protein